jgi:16S rRNA (guanine(1405)-N(7))-methyltransferase
MNDAASVIEANLRQTRKYRHLCDETLQRIANWAAARFEPKEALKAAKRKLHQVYAAYGPQSEACLKRVSQIPEGASDEAVRAACLDILQQHASTAERLAILDQLYPELWREIGRPATVMDLACGFHPFALPWMELDADTVYHACDIDQQLVGAVNQFLTHLGRPATARCRDLLVSVPEGSPDVVFLFKTLPCLEQQEKGASLQVLRALRSRFVIVSFPHESLGGKRKGMRGHYDAFMTGLVAALAVPVRKLEFAKETFYVLESRSF